MTVDRTVVFIVTPAADAAEADAVVKTVGEELERSGLRARFDLQQARAAEAKDLTRELLSRLAQGAGVVHICAREEGGGIVFDGARASVAPDAVADAIGLISDLVSTVCLSGCFTDTVAAAFTNVTPAVVGTTSAASPATIQAFFRGFYRGLANGLGAERAFDSGRIQAGLEQGEGSHCHYMSGREPQRKGDAERPADEHDERSGAHNLRPRNPSFTGREDVLDEIARTLASGSEAVVTQAFEGMGGVGKTELAIEFAYRNLHRYSIVWWIACQELDAIPGQLDELAQHLDLPGETVGERLQTLSRWFAAHGGWLLIADNVEQWSAVQRVLPTRGSGAILVTTRERGTHPDGIAIDVFTPEEALAFVTRRLRRTDHAATALADLLGRLPLALEQACSYLLTSGASVDEYIDLYRTRARELLERGETGGHDGTVTVTFNISLTQAKESAAADGYAVDPEPLATLLAFLAPDNIPLSLLDHLASDD
jgi:hypothetical protein